MNGLYKHYAEFLEQNFNWTYFLTARSPYRINTMTPIKWANRILNHKKVNTVFYIVERDKGDWLNKHVHMLLETSADMTYKETRTAFGNIAIGDYDLITDRTAVTTYVTKWIGNDCEYDLVYK
ncbi:hypothetical protein OAV50_02685 [Flavobacteriaceae bacterium]|nr:hypothetical protein [Flavobacteriaceae bacterium]